MKPGDLVRIHDFGAGFIRMVVEANGYLWIAEGPHYNAMPGIWTFKSVATGGRLYAFKDRFERVEDEAG